MLSHAFYMKPHNDRFEYNKQLMRAGELGKDIGISAYFDIVSLAISLRFLKYVLKMVTLQKLHTFYQF